MKKLLCPIFLLVTFFTYAQSNTEVYLGDLSTNNGKTTLTNLRNISKNPGYDNQPSFNGNSEILFARTRHDQTDIAQYSIESGGTSWVNDTPGGGEYSPLKIPGADAISAIRLDTTGLQRLYRYEMKSGTSQPILKDAKVGYHVWYSDTVLVHTILTENRMDLVVSNLKDNTSHTVQKNVGRALHKIPNTDLVSYIAKDETPWQVKSIHPTTGATALLTNLPQGVEDIVWLPDGQILVPFGDLIYTFLPESEGSPATISISALWELGTISRMAVSPDGNYLALVAEEHPGKIVQKQVDSYNAGDLDAFVNCYSENVLVAKFPNDTLYVGHERMRSNYNGLSPDNKQYDVEVVKRITIGNKVIDHEKVTNTNGTIVQMQIALYEVSNGTIDSMTFIFDQESPNPETIVQEQLDAYNNRDIEGFLETYTDDIELFNFPSQRRSKGKEEMRKGYGGYFESTPDLNCEIKNRMVIKNIVIDEEYITANGNNFSAVAIYEVSDGKIAKVTFLR